LNFTRIQILFPPQQIQIQIQIPTALHTPSNKTQGLNTDTNKLNEITKAMVYMDTNEEWENREQD